MDARPDATTFILPEPGATWVFAGDSITHGVQHTHGARSWVELVHERVRWQLGRLEDIVVNSGVSGWDASDVASRFDHLVGRFTPRVVSISLGTNDTMDATGSAEQFGHQIADLTRRATELGAQVVLHTPVLTLADAPAARRERLPAYAEQIRSVAHDHHVVLVDHERSWRAHFPDSDPIAWMDDHTHPNAVGHRQMAATTLRTLGLGDLCE